MRPTIYRGLGLIGLGLCSLTVQPCQASPHLSQDTAASLSQTFIRAVSGSPAVPASVANGSHADQRDHVKIQHYAADKAPDDPTNQDILALIGNHPHEYWQVEQPGKYEMEVDDVTGRVRKYVNYAASDAHNEQPAGEAIPKSQALNIAEAAIRATGETLDNLVLANIQERQDNLRPTASNHEWYISWLRTYHGIPYRREGAGVFLEAETGEIISVRVDAQSTDPATTALNVTREQALSVAEAQLNAVRLSLTELPLVSVKKEIVPFNTYWQSSDEAHHTLQTRVAWNCRFGTAQTSYEVWVDTATGDVIGGYDDSSLAGGGKIVSPQFGRQIKHTDLPATLFK